MVYNKSINKRYYSRNQFTSFIEKDFNIIVVNIKVISVKDFDSEEYYVSLGFKENLMKEAR